MRRRKTKSGLPDYPTPSTSVDAFIKHTKKEPTSNQYPEAGEDNPLPESWLLPPTKKLSAREGDTLTIKFDGATLQLEKFNNVILDSAIYSRKLVEGEDVDAAFAEVYAHLRTNVLSRAREKLAAFADELAKSRARSRGES